LKAVVKLGRGHGNIDYIDVPEPTPGPGELKVRVAAAGICGTDLHIKNEAFPYIPPVVLGHEFCGTVVELGAGVKRFRVGDRVAAEAPAGICGQCRYCKTGLYNLCSNRSGFGTKRNGAFAAYAVVEESMSHRIPDHVGDQAAALTEPLACVCRGVCDLTPLLAGETVAVLGPGPIGLLAVQVAKAAGARVVALGTAVDGARLELARQLGADATFDVQAEDAAQCLREMTGGDGADVVFECAGSPHAARLGFEIVRKGGRYTQIGIIDKPFEFDFNRIVMKELRVQGSFSQTWSAWETAIALVAQGKVRLEPLISARLAMRDWAQGFELFESKAGMKVVLLPEQ